MGLFTKKKNNERFLSPMSGKQLKISEIPDPVFSQKCMGDGFAIELADSMVVAPLSGEVISAFPTGHAFGLKTELGIEVLLHIGIDTVQLNGDGFNVKVKVGDYVNQGDTIVEVDIDKIKSSGKSLVSPVIFTSGQSVIPLKIGEKLKILESDIIDY